MPGADEALELIVTAQPEWSSRPATVAAGVDRPSLTLQAVLGRPVPASIDFADIAVVRYLEDTFLTMRDIAAVPDADAGRPVAAVPVSAGGSD